MRGIMFSDIPDNGPVLKPKETSLYLLDDEGNEKAVLVDYDAYWTMRAQEEFLLHILGAEKSEFGTTIDYYLEAGASRETIINDLAKRLQKDI
ncbi:hypothetical protein [Vibrio mediterranei]|uniref:hypothetical protein n=1 Tax=Vibrio mediterranei TaxID=689 RepID=UPI004067AD72